MPARKDWTWMVGQSFGRYTVTALLGRRKGHFIVRAACSCGRVREIGASYLATGSSQSCGCWIREKHTKHGQHKSITYRSWVSMCGRCRDPKATGFHNYGGRGIKVCERWHNFVNFLADMGERPGLEYSIDRYPNKDGNYELGNCRWATRTQQLNNKRVNHLITFDGKTQPLTTWANELGLDARTITGRLTEGWPIADTLLTPTLRRGGRRTRILLMDRKYIDRSVRGSGNRASRRAFGLRLKNDPSLLDKMERGTHSFLRPVSSGALLAALDTERRHFG